MKFIFDKDEQHFAIQFDRKEFRLAQKLMTHIVFSPDSAKVGVSICERLAKCVEEDTKPKPHLKLV